MAHTSEVGEGIWTVSFREFFLCGLFELFQFAPYPFEMVLIIQVE